MSLCDLAFKNIVQGVSVGVVAPADTYAGLAMQARMG